MKDPSFNTTDKSPADGQSSKDLLAKLKKGEELVRSQGHVYFHFERQLSVPSVSTAAPLSALDHQAHYSYQKSYPYSGHTYFSFYATKKEVGFALTMCQMAKCQEV
jgi:hypothetical protein